MTGLVPVTRPNGKTYRPKKPPVAIEVTGDWPERLYVYVLRTHDEERARELAMRLTTVYPVPVSVTWIREGIRDGDRFMQQNDVRGVPCVVFQVDD